MRRKNRIICLLTAAVLMLSGFPAAAEPEADSISENAGVPAQ